MLFRIKNTAIYSTIAFTCEGPRFLKQYDLKTEYATNRKLHDEFSAFDFESVGINQLSITAQINNNLDVLFSIRKTDVN